MKKIYTTISMCLLLCWAVTSNLSAQCLNTAPFGSGNIPTNNSILTLTTCAFAGEYSTANNAVAGTTIQFTMTNVGGTWITVRSGTPGGPVLAMGPSPLTFVNTFNGTIYAHLNTGPGCGSLTACHTVTVQCVSCTGPPPPPNDLCAGATPILCGGTVSGNTTTGATPDANPCGGAGSNGLWHTITPPSNGNVTLSLCGGASWDTRLSVYTGACTGLTMIACNDDFCGLQSQITFAALGGTTYRILVNAFTTNQGGAYTLSATCAGSGGPANDLCANATSLACNSSVNGTTVGATPDVVAICGNAANTPPFVGVWYTIVGNGGQVTLSTCTGTTYDSQITVYTGTCTGLTCLAGNDDACGLQSSVTFNSVLGTTYRVLVFGFGTATGAFTLTSVCGPPCSPPANDHCSNPGGGNVTIAPGGSNTFTGNSVCATSTNDGAFSAYPTVWHQFTTTGCASTVTVSYCGNVNWNNVWLNLGTNCTGTGPTTFTPAGTFVACGGPNSSFIVTFANLAAGTYWLAVLGQGNDPGFVVIPGPYSVNVSRAACPTPPGNDTPCPAMNGDPLYFLGTPTGTYTTRAYNLTNATADPGEISPGAGSITYGGGPAPGGSCNAINGWCDFETAVQNSVWYAFLAPPSGNIEINALGGDTQLGIYTAGLNCLDYSEFTEIGANDDALPGFQASIFHPCIGFALIPGNPYFIQIDGFAHANVIGTLQIRDPGPPSGGAPNDVCSGATSITIGTPVSGTTNCQSVEPYPACGTGTNATSPSVWYTFTGNGDRVSVGTCPGIGGSASFDTQVRVFTGSCTGLTCVAGNDDFCGLQSQVTFCSAIGTQYWVLIDGFGGAQGTFTLGSSATPGPQPTLVPTVFNCGYNVSCFGATDGSVTAVLPPAPGQLQITVSGPGFLDETEWVLRNSANVTIASGGPYGFGSNNVVLFTPQTTDYPVTFTINTQGSFNDNVANYTVRCVPTNTILVTGTLLGGQTFTSGPLLCSGAGAFTYSWSPGNQTTPTINNVGVGTYCVTVTDANGCSGTQCITLTGPNQLTATGTVSTYNCGYNVTCNGATDGSIDLTVSGGCAPYTYAWSNASASEDQSDIGAGEYNVAVTDANGCTATATFTLTQPDPMASSGVVSVYNCGYNVSCAGACDGSIDLTVSGGCAPYTYAWSNSSTTEDQSNLCAGTYTVAVTDANGCGTTNSFTLTEPAPVVVDAGPNQTVIFGFGSNCTVLTAGNASGGCPPYSYSWSNGDSTQSTTVCPTVSTDYTVTVTDANGCTGSDVVRVCVIDVRCGNNGNKVLVCHFPGGQPNNPHTICISSNAVVTHLTGHGDYLGPCGSNIPCDSTFKQAPMAAASGESESKLSAYPNPFSDATTVEFNVTEAQNVNVEVYSLTGVKVATLFNGQADPSAVYKLNFRPEAAASGIYIARMTTSTGIVKTEKLILQK